jgi:hypothetical protein
MGRCLSECHHFYHLGRDGILPGRGGCVCACVRVVSATRLFEGGAES